jgi:LysM repeat protein
MTENPTNTTICPTCGTRLNSNATRCSVCGAAISHAASAAKSVQVSSMPEITLSLPVVIGMIILLMAIGAGTVYGVIQATKPKESATAVLPTLTPSITPTTTVTPTETSTSTPEPTWTPEPPIVYKVQSGDNCGTIAYAFGINIQSIITLNDLPIACDTLRVGQELKVPRPTITPSPQPSSTLDPTQQAAAGCDKLDIIVTDKDTLSGIAAKYGVSIQALRDYNSLPGDIIVPNQKIMVPLCERGPKNTLTPTPIPPYPAANLLLPADGASFASASDQITLQWASVGELRQNESYAVTIEDVTAGTKKVDYVTDTKYIVPVDLRPTDAAPHSFRWSILPVRQVGSAKDTGQPVWEPAGSVSAQRVFSWIVNTVSTPKP